MSAIALALVLYSWLAIDASYAKKALSETEPPIGISLEGLPDGLYSGESEAGYVKAQADVYVSGGKAEKITIKLKGAFSLKGAKVSEAVIESQSTKVDAVTNATLSSTAALKAIENAAKSQAKPY